MRFTRIQLILLCLLLPQLNHMSDVLAESSRENNNSSARVLGGKPADIQDYPHVAALMYVDQKKGLVYYHCGCAIVGSHWVVTSAHCLWRARKVPLAIRSNSTYWNKRYTSRQVVKRVVHKGFNPRTLAFDVGMLKVKRAFDGKYERPFCLFTRRFEPAANSKVTLMGWGKMETEPFPRHLRAAPLFMVDRRKCQNVWRGHTHEGCTKQGQRARSIGKIDVTHICAGAPGKDACHGDSGSPLIQKDCLIGFVSWGSCKCDGKARPGIYTNVNFFSQWITWVRRMQ